LKSKWREVLELETWISFDIIVQDEFEKHAFRFIFGSVVDVETLYVIS